MGMLLWACASKPPSPTVEPLPSSGHVAAEEAAQERVPDAARGGDPPHPPAAPLPPFLGVARPTARYEGSTACAGCHAQEHASWQTTGHARSREVLEESSRQNDPSCLRCHTTGFGHPGGYGSGGSPALLNHTGCEACHGPGSDHIAAPGRGNGVLPAGFPACVACHTHDNSPDFDWASYWAKTAH